MPVSSNVNTQCPKFFFSELRLIYYSHIFFFFLNYLHRNGRKRIIQSNPKGNNEPIHLNGRIYIERNITFGNEKKKKTSLSCVLLLLPNRIKRSAAEIYTKMFVNINRAQRNKQPEEEYLLKKRMRGVYIQLQC